MSTERALANMCLAFDSIPRLGTPKLSSVDPKSIDGFYLLAAYCFDLARKMEYLFLATRDFARAADSVLAREIKTDNAQVYGTGASWREIAEREEAIILRLFTKEGIGKEHEQLLNEAAGTKER